MAIQYIFTIALVPSLAASVTMLLNQYKSLSQTIKLLLVLMLLCTARCTSQAPQVHNSPLFNSLRPPARLGAPAYAISGEHISLNFYAAVEHADHAKDDLQGTLQNFLEILQRNLTTSAVLNGIVNTADMNKTQNKLRKLNELATFFQIASEHAGTFALEAEHFFESTKNESNALLLKLRQVPSAQRFLPMAAKLHLTNYFNEMENFHVTLSEIADEALEYIVDTLRATERTFLLYADLQRDVLRHWNFNPDVLCCNRYMDFLQQFSAQIFKCAAGAELATAYDVYAMTQVTIKYMLRQLEFRIQRLYNCFIFGSYEIRCSFLRYPEEDFEKLFAKLEELQMYYDVKTNRGRVTTYWNSRRRRHHTERVVREDEQQEMAQEILNKCIPYGFPETQMPSRLKTCFNFSIL